MNKMNQPHPEKRPDALTRLVEYLSALNTQGGTEITTEGEMLSLIVSGALNGEDISRQYPTFYKKLLENPKLRVAFLDALELIEAERAGELAPMPGGFQTELTFLKAEPSAPLVEFLTAQKWRASWGKTLEQLRAIFSPPELAYRADPSLTEDPWFTLLREEMQTKDVTYDVMLDCTLSAENEEALSTSINLAVTLGSHEKDAGFPLRANLSWGDYHQSILINDEGRFNFPDVPMASVFDPTDSQPKAGFRLILESVS